LEKRSKKLLRFALETGTDTVEFNWDGGTIPFGFSGVRLNQLLATSIRDFRRPAGGTAGAFWSTFRVCACFCFAAILAFAACARAAADPAGTAACCADGAGFLGEALC